MRVLLTLTATALVAGCSSAPRGPVDEAGTLAAGDRTLASGELMDSYTVAMKPGQWIRVALHSSDFDPYLILRTPANTTSENDDAVEYDAQNSQLVFQATQAGQYEIAVTTYKAGEDGAYTLQYEVSDSTLVPVRNPQYEVTARTEKTGNLAQGDLTLSTGELMDPYPVHLTAGQQIRIRLHSSAFDPFLVFKKPGGELEQNDDAADGDTENSEIVFRAEAEGDYAVIVTSYEPGESGAYTLTIEPSSGAAPKRDRAVPGTRPDSGAPAAVSI